MVDGSRQAGVQDETGKEGCGALSEDERNSELWATTDVTAPMIREGLRVLYRSGRLPFGSEAPGADHLLMRDIIRSAIRAKPQSAA